MKAVTVLFVVYMHLLVLLSCAKTTVMLDKILVKNATDGTIEEVTIHYEPTKKFSSVNMILPGKTFELGLAGDGHPMMSTQAVVHWRDSHGVEWSVTLDLPRHKYFAENQKTVSLIYIINPNGNAILYLGK